MKDPEGRKTGRPESRRTATSRAAHGPGAGAAGKTALALASFAFFGLGLAGCSRIGDAIATLAPPRWDPDATVRTPFDKDRSDWPVTLGPRPPFVPPAAVPEAVTRGATVDSLTVTRLPAAPHLAPGPEAGPATGLPDSAPAANPGRPPAEPPPAIRPLPDAPSLPDARTERDPAPARKLDSGKARLLIAYHDLSADPPAGTRERLAGVVRAFRRGGFEQMTLVMRHPDPGALALSGQATDETLTDAFFLRLAFTRARGLKHHLQELGVAPGKVLVDVVDPTESSTSDGKHDDAGGQARVWFDF